MNSYTTDVRRNIKQNELEILIKDSKDVERGAIFTPTEKDADRIYKFLKEEIESHNSTTYTREELDYQLSTKHSMITAIENYEEKIIGISIAYPAKTFPQISEVLNWHPQKGFPRGIFTKDSIYSELRVIDPKYRGTGLGNLLRSTQIFEAVKNNYNRIVIYTVENAVKTNTGFGFREREVVNAVFNKKEIGKLHLMTLDISKDNIYKARNTIEEYRLK
jgi:GNAT superfamily N-acetyltransferase